MKNKRIFIIGGIYFTAITLVAVVFALYGFGVLKGDILSTFLIQVVVMFGIPLLMHTAFISKNIKQTFKDTGFKKISAKTLGVTIILGIVLYFLNSYVASFFQGLVAIFGYEKLSFGQTTQPLTSSLLFKEFILSSIFPAFCEEFLHRGVLLHSGKQCKNTRYVLIVSSILFGLTHLNINQFFYAAILGFLMGHISLITDSIFPPIIIHFLNNFLSVYFSYGSALNWPLATFVNNFTSLLASNIFIFVILTSFGVGILIWLYIQLTKQLHKERIKQNVKKIVDSLQLETLTIEQAEERVKQANELLKNCKTVNLATTAPKGTKFSFLETSFFISSAVLGVLITICSFIWGLI